MRGEPPRGTHGPCVPRDALSDFPGARVRRDGRLVFRNAVIGCDIANRWAAPSADGPSRAPAHRRGRMREEGPRSRRGRDEVTHLRSGRGCHAPSRRRQGRLLREKPMGCDRARQSGARTGRKADEPTVAADGLVPVGLSQCRKDQMKSWTALSAFSCGEGTVVGPPSPLLDTAWARAASAPLSARSIER